MSWKKVKLGDFLKVRDNRFKPNDQAISHLKRIEKIDFSGKIFISEKPSNTDMILIKKGDLVISGINVEKGAMAVYTGEEDITATIHYSSYSFDRNKTDIEFLKFFLKSIEFKNALKEQVPGGIKTEIKPKHLLPLVVQIPTNIKDQEKVVEILKSRNSKVEAISNELTHQLTLVKKLRQQLLQDAVQGKLVEQNKNDEPASELLKKIKAEKEKLIAEKKIKKEKELPPIKPEEIPFEIPNGWVWCKIGQLTTSIVPNRDKPATFTGEINWITQANFSDDDYKLNYNLTGKGLSTEEIIKYNCRIMPVGSIVMSCVGQFDLVCLIEKEIVANQQLHCFVPYCNVEPMYLCYAVKYFSKLIEKEAIQTTIKYINKTKCESILIPLPPLPEQNRIVQKLNDLLHYCNDVEASVIEGQTQNEKLLQQVLKEALRMETITK
jgi:type I restriction enzyme S subunit